MTAASTGLWPPALAGTLEAVGLDAACEAVYRLMLARPYEPAARLAQLAGLSPREVHHAIQRLCELGLARPSAQRDGQVWAVSPHAGMEVLLARQQADLAARQLRLEDCRVAVARLLADFPVPQSQAATGTQHVLGPDRLTDLLAVLARTARSEIMGFCPGGSQARQALADLRPFEHRLRDPELSARCVYLDSVRTDPAAAARAGRLSELGAQVRTAAELPSWMIIIDRAAALVPVRPGQGAEGSLLMTSEGQLTGLCALFDLVWAAALPLGEPARPDEHGLTRQQAAVVRLLAAGLTDEAIARRLAISHRSARRTAGDLMARLGARSRFQAGVRAAERGWLSTGPALEPPGPTP